jgi:3-oxoacyl-[acyl-carrier-protein] synthase II
VQLTITGSDMVTCLGGAAATVEALAAGRCGLGPLRFAEAKALTVDFGFHVDDGETERPRRVAGWLARCAAAAVAESGLDPARQRVAAVVGTGLRDLRAVERWHADGLPIDPDDIHFGRAVRDAVPGLADVVTLANACAASGHALAVASDLLALGDADAVVVAGADAMTESMLAMIGRVVDEPTDALRPFDGGRRGVLLGEGAAAVVVQPAGRVETGPRRPAARVLAVGVSCDAQHETAPLASGQLAAMRDAYERAGISPADVGLVVAHGTGTALNDPTEAAALAELFAGVEPGPLVTGLKGAIGHTSGAAFLMNALVAVEAMRSGRVPPVVGLRTPMPEAAGLRLVLDEAAPTHARIAQINAFGFGGVNAVGLIEVDR